MRAPRGGRDDRGRPRQPERLAGAVGKFAEAVGPETPEGKVQGVWAEVVGAKVAAVTRVIEEREGTVRVQCESAVWAEELSLMEARIRGQLNEVLVARGGDPVDRHSYQSVD
ncbi:MAG: DciA family protein [Solirubrobacterales bacterium]